MEGLIFLAAIILLNLLLKNVRGGPRRPPARTPKAPPARGDGEPGLSDRLAEMIAAWQPPPAPPQVRRVAIHKKPQPREEPALPAPAAVRKPAAPPVLPGPDTLTHPRAALHGIVLAEIFGPPRCRRPHRPPAG